MSRLPLISALNFFRTFIRALLIQRRSAAISRRLQPGLRRLRAHLPVRDLIDVFERKSDIVEAFNEPRAIGGRNFKSDIRAAGAADPLRHQIDSERGFAIGRDYAGDELIAKRGAEHDRQQTVLQTVFAINIGKAFGNDDANAVGQHAPDRGFARRPGAEIFAGHQNSRRAKLRLVEDKIRIFAAVFAPPRAMKQHGAIILFEAARMQNRRDLIGVDVVLDQWRGNAGMAGEGLHHAAPGASWRASAIRPAIALAAAVAGLARCVRTFGPWRFSKLRLVVETQRSPGWPRSPLPPAHIEQPDSPQKNPASRNTRSRPTASASRFTVLEPGTTIATTPSATRRPRTIAAAACKSGRRLLVQEPMNTRSTLRPASVMPGVRPI